MGDAPEGKSRMMAPEEFADEEKNLQQFPFYHGFIARDDLNELLGKEGDYLLRVSETDPMNGVTEVKKEIVLSVAIGGQKEETSVNLEKDAKPKEDRTKARIKHVIIHRKDSKYYVEIKKAFDNLKDLHEHYQNNYGTLRHNKFILKHAIHLQRWEHLHKDINLGKVLGAGAFGEVRQGELTKRNGKKVDVAVKLLKGTSAMIVGKEKIKEMMNEARLMRHFKHRNVVRIYGVAVHQQPIYIVLELVKGGSLFSYLQKNTGTISVKEKLNMCYGAALGIEYLHSNKCIHRDLAARNCLYTIEKIMKISDFGLSKMGTHYNIKTPTKLPIKWLAPETIARLFFSLKTDVYSYGVVIYEIFTDGGEPWGDMKNAEVKKQLREGKFLQLPNQCPEKVRAFVAEKIYVPEERRASMAEVTSFLRSNVADDLDKSLYVDKTTKSTMSSQKPSDRSGKTQSMYSSMAPIGTKEGMGSIRKKKKGFHHARAKPSTEKSEKPT